MKNSQSADNKKWKTSERGGDSLQLIEEKKTEKKPYASPTLQRYTSPKLRKHKSYKDITMLFAVIPPVPPTS